MSPTSEQHHTQSKYKMHNVFLMDAVPVCVWARTFWSLSCEEEPYRYPMIKRVLRKTHTHRHTLVGKAQGNKIRHELQTVAAKIRWAGESAKEALISPTEPLSSRAVLSLTNDLITLYDRAVPWSHWASHWSLCPAWFYKFEHCWDAH